MSSTSCWYKRKLVYLLLQCSSSLARCYALNIWPNTHVSIQNSNSAKSITLQENHLIFLACVPCDFDLVFSQASVPMVTVLADSVSEELISSAQTKKQTLYVLTTNEITVSFSTVLTLPYHQVILCFTLGQNTVGRERCASNSRLARLGSIHRSPDTEKTSNPCFTSNWLDGCETNDSTVFSQGQVVIEKIFPQLWKPFGKELDWGRSRPLLLRISSARATSCTSSACTKSKLDKI